MSIDTAIESLLGFEGEIDKCCDENDCSEDLKDFLSALSFDIRLTRYGLEDHECEDECDGSCRSHDCDEHCSHGLDDEDDLEVKIQLGHPAVREAIEDSSPWLRSELDELLGHPTACQRKGCYGFLWVEYLGSYRYFVKCTNGCRIIYVSADSISDALNQANGKEEK